MHQKERGKRLIEQLGKISTRRELLKSATVTTIAGVIGLTGETLVSPADYSALARKRQKKRGGKVSAAATCGGNIVARTGVYRGHYAIWVDRAPRATRITYFNGSSNEVVPNADNAVRYSPIGQEGQYFIYGVSKRWVSQPSHWSWWQTWRWRVSYSC